jgi:hypothetical protein
MIRRRSAQTFSLSFLDCICCGFGAIILIFVLTIGSRERVKLEILTDLQRALAGQIAELTQLDTKKQELQASQQRLTNRVVEARKSHAEILAMVDDMERQLQRQKSGLQALLVDIDDLKKNVALRQKKPDIKLLPDVKPTPVGLPTDNNYIAIVIDTSGSMRDPNHGGLWPIVIRKVDELLDSYPELKGLQLIDGDGRFIMGRPGTGTAGWLDDSPERRDQIKRYLRRYDQDSISNPVPGVYNAIRFLLDRENPEMKMAIYVFGDEFIDVADPVIRRLDELNPADENGNRKVVINAIGFPTTIRYTFSMGNTGLKFANLMRTVTYQHGGAFIALQDL